MTIIMLLGLTHIDGMRIKNADKIKELRDEMIKRDQEIKFLIQVLSNTHKEHRHIYHDGSVK